MNPVAETIPVPSRGWLSTDRQHTISLQGYYRIWLLIGGGNHIAKVLPCWDEAIPFLKREEN